ncbi:uncharacterized protein LOC113799315 [Dermatophagoides pteronyssinus]|uniref:uncharacterized protein LOC113799315 n=1 Tax=Dermatophagoides pteronyssinus TaxID=6956 RepID=UPI003F663F21
MVSCRGSIAKAILCMMNATFIMISLAMILLGLQMKVQQTTLSYEMDNSNMTTNSYPYNDESVELMGIMKWDRMANLLLLIGTFLIIISIYGFCAALNESSLLLNIYIYFLSIISLAVWVTVIFILMFNPTLFEYSRHLFIARMEVISNPTHRDRINHALFLQNFQQIFHCCGIDSPNDWSNSTFGNVSLGRERLPASCCSNERQQKQDLSIKLFMKEDSYKTCVKDQMTYHDGCFSSIQILRYRLFGLMIISAVILMLALLLALTCCLERDKRLQFAHMVNMQYATHLSGCHQSPHELGYFGRRIHCPFRKSSVESQGEQNLKRTMMSSMIES